MILGIYLTLFYEQVTTMSPNLKELHSLRGELIKGLTALQLSEGDEAEIEAKIGNVQRKISPLGISIFMSSQPR